MTGGETPHHLMQTSRCWTYEQATGILLNAANEVAGKGYSGFGDGKNNPDAQSQEGVGPLPRGVYVIETPHDSLQVGPYAMCLTPSPDNQMFGRADFLIHGDSVSHPGKASHGCVILPLPLRKEIWESGDHMLEVVHG